MELKVPVYTVKRIHNIRDFAYRVELREGISLGDLALYLNALGGDAFFWTDGETLHSTSEVDLFEILPEALREYVVKVEKVKEGYLSQSALPKYTAFALIAADFNRVLSPNFKANPLFKRLRRRTKEGWNLSLWQKFLHELSLTKKATGKGGTEYQIVRWMDIVVENDTYISLPLRGGIALNENPEGLLQRLDDEILKELFAFRIRGTYRFGYAEGVDWKRKTLRLKLGGLYETEVPLEKLVAVYLPDRDERGWKSRDRLKLLKGLRLPPKIVCKYAQLLTEAVNRLLEPYMVSLSEYTPRGERVKVSPFVVVDKPVPLSEAAEYVVKEGMVYSNPFGNKVEINFIDLFERSEKNKKLLRDARNKFLEDLKGFFSKIGVSAEVKTAVWQKKIKRWDSAVIPELGEFLKTLKGELEKADFNIFLIPEGETVEDRIALLPVERFLRKEAAAFGGTVLDDGWIKLYLKTAKEDKRAKMLLSVLGKIFAIKGGAPYILDEPLPYGKVAVETERGVELFSMFGEPLGAVENFGPSEEEPLITHRSRKNAVFVDKRSPLPIVNVEGGCSEVPKGVFFTLDRRNAYAVLEEGGFSHSVAAALRSDTEFKAGKLVETLLKLKKLPYFWGGAG